MNKCVVIYRQQSFRRYLQLILSLAIITCLLLLYGQHIRRPVQDNAIKDANITHHLESDDKHERLKRFIIFNGSGVVKLVLGISFPIILPNTRRNLGVFYNLQMQYTPPPRPVYWWSLYNTTTFAARKERSSDILRQHDNGRSHLFAFFEAALQQRWGQFGRECLLKVICEIARAPLTEDFDAQDVGNVARHEYSIEDDYGRNIYHALINAIFTPHLPNVMRRYWDARVAGLRGSNCDELFAKCFGMNDWLKRFTRFISNDQTLKNPNKI